MRYKHSFAFLSFFFIIVVVAAAATTRRSSCIERSPHANGFNFLWILCVGTTTWWKRVWVCVVCFIEFHIICTNSILFSCDGTVVSILHEERHSLCSGTPHSRSICLPVKRKVVGWNSLKLNFPASIDSKHENDTIVMRNWKWLLVFCCAKMPA